MHPVPRALLAPLARAYGLAVALRNRRFDRTHGLSVGIPVVCVGNLTVGGTGKTPIVEWLARRLLGRGLRPAVVSRGYGGRAGSGPRLVSLGEGPQCGADVCGDEPFLLARRLSGALVIVGSDRHAGAVLARREGADAVLLDDGFQHRRLARNLDVVLLDATDPFGGGRLLPAGRLREPVSGLRRADVILVTRSRSDRHWPEIERVVRKHNASAPILLAGHRATGFVDASGQPVDRPERAIAFCGIGNPERFRIDLGAAGIRPVGFRVFPDHHAYSAADLVELRYRARKERAAAVTTEKDLARLGGWGSDPSAPPLLALAIEAEIFEPDPLLRLLDAVLTGGAARNG